MSYSDQQLRKAVDAVFKQYDKDQSGQLQRNQLKPLILAVFKHMKVPKKDEEVDKYVNQVIAIMDQNKDGIVGKPELFMAFKRLSMK